MSEKPKEGKVKCEPGYEAEERDGTSGSRGIWGQDVAYCKKTPGEKKSKAKKAAKKPAAKPAEKEAPAPMEAPKPAAKPASKGKGKKKKK